MIICEDDFNLVESLRVYHELINSINDLYVVLVWTFIIFLVSFLEGYNNQVAIFELFDNPLNSLNIVNLHLLSGPILIYISSVSLKAY